MRILLLIVAVALARPGLAHDARPLSVTLIEQAEGVYRTVVRAPPTLEPQNAPAIVWPDACELRETAPLRLGSGSTSLVSCAGGLAGRTVRIDYPLYNPALTALFRLEPAEGAAITAVLAPDEFSWTVPAERTLVAVARDYIALGIEHIWTGIDHLLFVAGLMLLARKPRRIVLAVTGFTVAHSVTLSLAALGFVRVPIEPVEAMIALSILFLAAEIARDDSSSFSHRFPIALSFVFGLLHGFGFAAALGEIGLPRAELVAGLLFFNLGVELGQLAFIAFVTALFMAGRRLVTAATVRPERLTLLGAYCLGIPAAFWFVERTALAFGV
jgi:hydrogenase/urease accessory protein HupE